MNPVRLATRATVVCLVAALSWSSSALAQTAAPTDTAPPAETAAPAPAPAPPPYSIPWQLRPAAAGNVVRLDSTLALHDSAFSSAYLLLGSYRIIPNFAVMLRLGLAQNGPDEGDGATVFVNPAVGATYVLSLPSNMRLAFFLGLTVPVGMGGGDDPDLADVAARSSGIWTRAAMDNAMFAVNDFTVFPGVDFAWVSGGLTVQAEVTLLELIRVRGGCSANPCEPGRQADETKTNLTMGLHVGYFIIPQLSLGAEIRHQRWLTTPAAVEADEARPDDMQVGARDTTTWAVGARVHVPLGDGMSIRPGIAFSMALDGPMFGDPPGEDYKLIQIDIPFAF